MTNQKNESGKMAHEFRKGGVDFSTPVAWFVAPYSNQVSIRWYATDAGGFAASRVVFGHEAFAFVTVAQPYKLAFLPLAPYPDMRLFSGEKADFQNWCQSWFDEFEPVFTMFMDGPSGKSGGAA